MRVVWLRRGSVDGCGCGGGAVTTTGATTGRATPLALFSAFLDLIISICSCGYPFWTLSAQQPCNPPWIGSGIWELNSATTATLACNPGFAVSPAGADATITCTNGVWTNAAVYCVWSPTQV